MAGSASASEMKSIRSICSVISLLLVMITRLAVTNGQNFVPTVSIPATQAYFTQQTYPWGFSYSFSEIGKSHNAASSKTAITNSGFQTANNVIVPVQLGIPFASRLPFIPLPLLRNGNESSSLVVPTPNGPNPIENPKEDEKTATVYPTTTTTTTTTSSPPVETTPSAEIKINLPNSKIDEKSLETPKTGFYFTRLSSPLTFSYGYTTIGASPLPIPHLPLFGFGYNSSSPPTPKQNEITKENDKKEPSEKIDTTTAAATTTSSVTENTEKSDNDSEKDSSNKEDTTEAKSESFSESTTEITMAEKEEDDPNLETETISTMKSQNEDPFGKLKVAEDSESSDNEDSPTTNTPVTTTTTTTNTPTTTTSTTTTENTVSSTILTNAIDDTASTTTPRKSNIILITGNDKSEFSYSVKDEVTFDEKSHEEQRNGDVVKGKYSVVEPDGALRTVTYYANEDGFKADVVRKESYTKPFPVFQNSITRAPGAIQSLSHQNVLSYYYNGFQFPPPNPGVLRNFGYGYIV